MQPEKDDEGQDVPDEDAREQKAEHGRADIGEQVPPIAFLRQGDHEGKRRHQVSGDLQSRHQNPHRQGDRGEGAGDRRQRDFVSGYFFHPAPLPAAAAEVEQAVDAKAGVAIGQARRAGVPAHLTVVDGRAVPGGVRVVLLLCSLTLVVVFRVDFAVGFLIFAVAGVHLHRDFELLFALVRPIFLIEYDGLEIVPFGAPLVEGVQLRLRFGELLRFQEGGDLFVGALPLRVLRPLPALRHDLVVGGVQPAQHARGFVARFAVQPSVFVVLIFEFGVLLSDFLVRGVFRHAEEVVKFLVHRLETVSPFPPLPRGAFFVLFAFRPVRVRLRAGGGSAFALARPRAHHPFRLRGQAPQ